MNRRGFLFGVGALAATPLVSLASRTHEAGPPEYVAWGDAYWDRDFAAETWTRLVKWRVWDVAGQCYQAYGLGAHVTQADLRDGRHQAIVRGFNRCLEQLRAQYDWPFSLLIAAGENQNPRYFPGATPSVRVAERNITGLIYV